MGDTSMDQAVPAHPPGFGECGDAYGRIGRVENRHPPRQAAHNIKIVLGNHHKMLEESKKQRTSSSS